MKTEAQTELDWYRQQTQRLYLYTWPQRTMPMQDGETRDAMTEIVNEHKERHERHAVTMAAIRGKLGVDND